MLTLVVLLALLAVSLATTGVDVSQRTPLSSWQCAKNNGFTFAVVRVYRSSGSVDPNGPANIADAWKGGMKYVDGYIFPCYSCGNPAKQMDDTINYLAANGVNMATPEEVVGSASNATVDATRYGMLWLDIEGTSFWSTSSANNVNFVQAMVDQGKKRGVTLGIYSSASQWNPIMGGTTKFSSLPIWYAHYDNKLTFSDFSPFGGWTKPAIKQYAGDVSFCSAGWDKNFY